MALGCEYHLLNLEIANSSYRSVKKSTSIAGLMGPNRGHWSLAIISDKATYVIQGSFDGLYVLKMPSGSFWDQTYYSKPVCSQVPGLNVQQNRGQSRLVSADLIHRKVVQVLFS